LNPFASLHGVIERGGPAGRFLVRLSIGRDPIKVLATVRPPIPTMKTASGLRTLVSVVVPCYNYGRYLPACVASITAQAGADLEVEIIIVDDVSTDDSLEVARRLAKDDPRVRVLANDRNLGPVGTFNAGLATVTGTFTARLDADDLLAPGSLARAVSVFERFASVGLVYGHPRHFTTPEPPAPHAGPVTSWTIWRGVDWLEGRCRRSVNCITSPEVVMRQSVVDRVGGQRELAQSHDMEMWMRISAVSDVGYVHGPDQALHRDHALSRSARMVDSMTDLLERRAAFQTLFDGVGADLDRAGELHELANRSLALDALERVQHAQERSGRSTESQHSLDDYAAFAVETFPGARDLPQWSITQRPNGGADRVGGIRPVGRVRSFVRAAGRRLRSEYEYARWTRTGL
jgi:hypothetical protein